MSRRIVAGALTVVLMGVILARGTRGPRARPAADRRAVSDPARSPEECVRRVIEAARAGDVATYLDAYAEPLRSRIAREADEAGRSRFAEDLRRVAGSRKGFALYAPEPDGPDAVRIEFEAIYPDRNERQAYRLERGPAGWRIAGVGPIRGREPPDRFGATARYKAPEGVPIEGVEPSDPDEDPEP